MIQTKSKTVIVLHALALFAVLISTSCGGRKENEGAASDSTSVEFEPNDSNVVTDSVVTQDLTTFCCGNHSPVHCGATTELESLTRAHGCIDFRTP